MKDDCAYAIHSRGTLGSDCASVQSYPTCVVMCVCRSHTHPWVAFGRAIAEPILRPYRSVAPTYMDR